MTYWPLQISTKIRHKIAASRKINTTKYGSYLHSSWLIFWSHPGHPRHAERWNKFSLRYISNFTGLVMRFSKIKKNNKPPLRPLWYKLSDFEPIPFGTVRTMLPSWIGFYRLIVGNSPWIIHTYPYLYQKIFVDEIITIARKMFPALPMLIIPFTSVSWAQLRTSYKVERRRPQPSKGTLRLYSSSLADF